MCCAFRLDVERAPDEDVKHMLERQAAPDECSPVVIMSTWSAEVLTSLNEAALEQLRQHHCLEEETTNSESVHWGSGDGIR